MSGEPEHDDPTAALAQRTNATPADPLGKIWEGDLLDRKADASYLENFLTGEMQRRLKAGVHGSYVIEIDAEWGAGKTFFMTRFADQLRLAGHIVAEVNAWKDDFLGDPLASIVAAFEEALGPLGKDGNAPTTPIWRKALGYIAPVLKRSASSGIGAAAAGAAGVAIDPTGGILAGAAAAAAKSLGSDAENLAGQGIDAIMARFQGNRKISDDFRAQLGKLVAALPEASRPMFVLVDELDRCRPPYAVALLERVKHLFDVDNLVFVFATNADQLQHCVAGAYGSNFDGFRYMKRFFDKTYKFERPNLEKLIRANLEGIDFGKLRAPIDRPKEFLIEILNACGAEPRDANRILLQIAAVTAAWTGDIRADLLTLLVLVIGTEYPERAIFDAAQRPAGTASNVPADLRPHLAIPPGYLVKVGMRAEPSGVIGPVQANVARTAEQILEWASRKASIGKLIEGENVSGNVLYARRLFAPEQQLLIDTALPSVQARLPMMVRMAGRFVADKT